MITERKHTEQVLKKSQEQYRSILDHVKEVIFQTDMNGTWTFLNPAWQDMTGFRIDESLGENFLHFVHPDDQQRNIELFKPLINRQKSQCRHEIRYIRKDGGYCWVEVFAQLTVDDNNQAVGTSGTLSDITSRKELEAYLISAKDKAEKESLAKSRFLSQMSHELRTPLNAILGFSQLLEFNSDPPLTESQLNDVKEISKAGTHILQLLNELLDLTRIETGNITLSLKPVNISKMVSSCVRLVKPLAEKRSVRLHFDDVLQKTDIFVHADEIRLKQVLLNLLSNAIKYNRESGEVQIFGEHSLDNKVRIMVKDTGNGISEAELPFVFNPFYRMDQHKHIEGSGVGLTITKQLVELMGGLIGVNSQLHVGSQFYIEMRKISPISGIESNELLDTWHSSMFDNENQYLILYIEDNPANLRLVERMLSHDKRIHITSAHNGKLGIELAKTHQPDIILLDINLPDLDGYEVYNQLQKIEETMHIPVMAVSANAMPENVKKGLAHGFKHYLTKPIHMVELINCINHLIEEIRPKI